MRNFFYSWLATILGRNVGKTPTDVINQQMREARPLPLGRQEFEEWSHRIYVGSMIPGLTEESCKFVLADMLLHLGPTEDHKPDAFFIHSIRKHAINQVAFELRKELYEAKKARDELSGPALTIVPQEQSATVQ